MDRPDKIPVMYRTAPLSTQIVSATAVVLAIALPASNIEIVLDACPP